MSYRIEWIGPAALIGALTLLMIPVVGAMVGLAVVLLVAAATLVAIVGAIVALPFLLVRAVHRRWRSGQARPAYIAQTKVRKEPLLTVVGEQAAVPVSHPATR
jgi:O-antigen/teichoic acid export membrane protein